MAKRIKITEGQIKRLFEAMRPEFRLDALRNMSFANKVKYCTQMLGRPIGRGSSRLVFQIDDETVLKLAMNGKGIAQNEQELRFKDDYYMGHCFPNIYNGSDEENYLWIVSEYVLPAKKEDFENALNMPFEDVVDFIDAFCLSNSRDQNWRKWGDVSVKKLYEKYEENSDATELMNDISELYYGYNMEIGDYRRIDNYGLVMREGYPTIVFIDAGLSKEVFSQYYGRRR